MHLSFSGITSLIISKKSLKTCLNSSTILILYNNNNNNTNINTTNTNTNNKYKNGKDRYHHHVPLKLIYSFSSDPLMTEMKTT